MRLTPQFIPWLLGALLLGALPGTGHAGTTPLLLEAPRLEALCDALSAKTGVRLRLDHAADSERDHDATGARCLGPQGTPWALRLDGENPQALRMMQPALDALLDERGDSHATLGTALALDRAESAIVKAEGPMRLEAAPARDSACLPVQEARERLASVMSTLGLETPAVDPPGPGTSRYVCVPEDSRLALLVNDDGRVGRIGLSPDLLRSLDRKDLDSPDAFLRALASQLPTRLSQLPEEGVELTLTYRGGRQLNVSVSAFHLDYRLR